MGDLNKVAELLEQFRLGDYLVPLKELGVRDPADLLDIEAEDADAMGMTRLEQRRFFKRLHPMLGGDAAPHSPPARASGGAYRSPGTGAAAGVQAATRSSATVGAPAHSHKRHNGAKRRSRSPRGQEAAVRAMLASIAAGEPVPEEDLAPVAVDPPPLPSPTVHTHRGRGGGSKSATSTERVEGGPEGAGGGRASPSGSPLPPPPAVQWQELEDENHYLYYHHVPTGRVQWEVPNAPYAKVGTTTAEASAALAREEAPRSGPSKKRSPSKKSSHIRERGRKTTRGAASRGRSHSPRPAATSPGGSYAQTMGGYLPHERPNAQPAAGGSDTSGHGSSPTHSKKSPRPRRKGRRGKRSPASSSKGASSPTSADGETIHRAQRFDSRAKVLHRLQLAREVAERRRRAAADHKKRSDTTARARWRSAWQEALGTTAGDSDDEEGAGSGSKSRKTSKTAPPPEVAVVPYQLTSKRRHKKQSWGDGLRAGLKQRRDPTDDERSRSRKQYRQLVKAAGDTRSDVYSRLTDVRSFTGTHKQRFDKTGRGLGLAGRERAEQDVDLLKKEGDFGPLCLRPTYNDPLTSTLSFRFD